MDLITHWTTMEAGRDLDRLIAERAGWHPVTRSGMWAIAPPHIQDADQYIAWRRGLTASTVLVAVLLMASEDEAWNILCPHFTTSVDAALALLPDALHTRQWSYLQNYTDNRCQMWRATIIVAAQEGIRYIGEAEGLALAICRAWLAWQDGGEAETPPYLYEIGSL